MLENPEPRVRYPTGTPVLGLNEVRRPESSNSKTSRVTTRELDEEQPLLASSSNKNADGNVANELDGTILTSAVMAVLLLGEFVAHADTTLIFASAAHIASELGSLKSASWLAAGYTLAVCSTQPLYGRLCDVFGRKPVLLSAYSVLSFGCILCGFSTSIWQIVGGRVISGIGGAGVMTMASIVITDSVPKRDIATYRSYINIATTLGRSVGGPLGGLVADKMGWQWLFFLRIPIFAISILLLGTNLKPKHHPDEDPQSPQPSFYEKFSKLDLIGACLLSSTITLTVVLIDEAGSGHLTPLALLMVALAGLFANIFVYQQIFISKNPILDLRILVRPNVALSYLINYLQVFAQVGMMFSIPMYFQVTQRASVTASGAHLVPAVVGNTAGAIIAGVLIRKTQQFKGILVGTGLLGCVTYVLLFVCWNGATSDAESMYIIPAGLATGMAQSAAFVSMASLLDPPEVAMATGVYFLTSSLGTVTGITTTNLLISSFFEINLQKALPGPSSRDTIKRVLRDMDYIAELQGHTRQIVVAAFIASMKSTYILGICSGLTASCLALMLRPAEL